MSVLSMGFTVLSLLRMEPALVEFGIFPPPAAGADVFAWRDRAGAGGAADAGIALRMERVHRHVVLAHIVPHIFFGPIGQRVELLEAMSGIPFLCRDLAAPRRLAAAQARHPGFLAGESAL